jgi:hypothetical protein
VANISPTLDHLTYEALIQLVLGQRNSMLPTQLTLARTAIDTIITAIQAQDATFDVPNRAERKLLALV